MEHERCFELTLKSGICLKAYWKSNLYHKTSIYKYLVCANIKICNCGQSEVQQAIENKKIGDLEDGVQYYSAKNASCDYIVTYNQKDFFFSQLEVLLPEEMLGKCLHLLKK